MSIQDLGYKKELEKGNELRREYIKALGTIQNLVKEFDSLMDEDAKLLTKLAESEIIPSNPDWWPELVSQSVLLEEDYPAIAANIRVIMGSYENILIELDKFIISKNKVYLIAKDKVKSYI